MNYTTQMDAARKGMFSTFTAHISAAYVDHQSLRRKKKTVRPHKERTAKYMYYT